MKKILIEFLLIPAIWFGGMIAGLIFGSPIASTIVFGLYVLRSLAMIINPDRSILMNLSDGSSEESYDQVRGVIGFIAGAILLVLFIINNF